MLAFIGALILGGILLGLAILLMKSKLNLKWFHWLIGTIALLLVLGAVQHYFGSVAEGYSNAGLMGALFLGLPGLILLVINWQLVIRMQNQNGSQNKL